MNLKYFEFSQFALKNGFLKVSNSAKEIFTLYCICLVFLFCVDLSYGKHFDSDLNNFLVILYPFNYYNT